MGQKVPPARAPTQENGTPPLVDGILDRAFKLRYTLMDLDAICVSGRYFQTMTWRKGCGHHGFLLRAVEELGGHVEVAWDDDQYD